MSEEEPEKKEEKLSNTFIVLSENEGFKLYQLYLKRQEEAYRKQANDLIVHDSLSMVQAAHFKGMADAFETARLIPETFKEALKNQKMMDEYNEIVDKKNKE